MLGVELSSDLQTFPFNFKYYGGGGRYHKGGG